MKFYKHYSIIGLFLTAGFLLPAEQAGAQGFYFYNRDFYESQTVIEFGLQGGGMNGMTDLGGSKKGTANSGFLQDFTLKKSHFTAGAYLAATYKDFLAGRIDVNFGKIESADSFLKGATDKYAVGRLDRNLSFRSNIFEVALNVELHPFFVIDYVYGEPPRWSPYIFGGIGYIKFNPQANLNGIWYDLAPLSLEGQGFAEYPDRPAYKKHAYSFPLGMGVRYENSQLINIRLEVARHLTSTDYLDDVSQGDWVDPNLFYKYLSASKANVAAQLYNRSTTINPPRNTRPRGDPRDHDTFWNIVLKIGFTLNRERIKESVFRLDRKGRIF